ncbi:MAG TPA: SRPBCC domain-containing protein [Caulobacteraceae bacterium]|nr:SRPBCC domain-containing protein [Caulobacteraceae bacterium]
MGATLQPDGWVAPDDPRDAWVRQHPDGTFEMRFERSVPRPVERVWAAITVPERIADWLGTPIQIDAHVGGKFIVAFPHGRDDMVEGTIVACEPPHLLAFEWGDGIVRWEITPRQGGCLMIFTQTGLNAWWFLGAAAGWMGMVDDILSIACGGTAHEIEGGYRAAVERYKRDYGPFVPGFDVRPTLRNGESPAFVTRAPGGRYTVRYARRMMLPIEKVWAALTEPERLADWLAVAKVDLRVGGEVELTWPTANFAARYVIREIEPPNLMVWGSTDPDNPQAELRWLLFQEDPDFMGTRLVLIETLLPPEHLLSIATGWHAHLHDLPEAALREAPLPWSAEREQARAAREVAELSPRYRERLRRDAPDAV